jgi:dihydropyrimidinase
VLLVNGIVVDVDGERRAEVRIGRDGRIAAVGDALAPDDGETVVDCAGCLVVPGGIDVHTHLHLPVGAVHVSDDFASGTRAAAIGGTTTVVDYVTAYRGEDPLAALATWRRLAEPACVDYGLHMTFTERVPERVIADCVEAGVTSFKLYMAYPELLQVDDDVIVDVMLAATRHGGLVTLHCENGGAIEALRRQALAAGRTGVLEHATSRPAILEAEAVQRAAALAEVAGASVYLVHLSSAPALAAVREARDRGVDALAETCPQYLYLDTSRLAGPDGDSFVCTPPLRDPWHAEELWHGMATGAVHTVATDHCPFTVADRRAGTRARPDGWADFTEIPGGLPGIETRLGLVWEGVVAGRITRADWVRLCAEAPARTFGMWPTKGNLRVGADADVVVWNPERRQSLAASALHMNVDHSPYEDVTVAGWPDLVLARGDVVARDGAFVGEPARGRYVARTPRLSR